MASGYLPGFPSQRPDLPGYQPPAPRRAGPPPSIAALVVFQYVAGTAALVAAAAAIAAERLPVVGAWPLPPPLAGWLDGLGVAGAVGLGALALALLVLARALRAGRARARLLLVGMCLPTSAVTLWAGLAGRPVQPLIGLVLPVAYLILLNTAPARRWFRRSVPPAAPAPAPIATRRWYRAAGAHPGWPGPATGSGNSRWSGGASWPGAVRWPGTGRWPGTVRWPRAAKWPPGGSGRSGRGWRAGRRWPGADPVRRAPDRRHSAMIRSRKSL